MKLTTDDIQKLNLIISTCLIGGIESVIIEPGKVRGVNESKTFAIISDFEIPNFSQVIGLTRLSTLKSRLDIFNSLPSLIINAAESSRDEISMLEISSGKNKVQFKCASTALIKAPHNIADSECFKLFLSKQEMKMILDGIKVMNCKKMVMNVRNDKSVIVELPDPSNEVFSIELDNKAQALSEEDSSVQYYPADIVSAVIRNKINTEDVSSFTIGVKGTLKTTLNGHQVTTMPQIGD